jgi:hypothetical protein
MGRALERRVLAQSADAGSNPQFAPGVLLLWRSSNGRKLQRRRERQPFLRQEGQYQSRLIGRTFERELGIGFFDTVPPPFTRGLNFLSPLFLARKPQWLRLPGHRLADPVCPVRFF